MDGPSPPIPAAEREKRDSQAIIDTLRDTLEERNATVESLQKALDEAEMLCSTLKVGPQVLWAPVGEEIQPQFWAHRSRLNFWFCLGQWLGFFRRPPCAHPAHKKRATLATLTHLY